MKTLLLFCSSNYTNVNKDLISNKFDLFDKVVLLNETNLDKYINNVINNIIDKYGPRGYGYWIWKPYIILQELNKLNNGDILVHLDMHCSLDKVKNKFDNIINNLNNDKPLIIATTGFPEYMYTTNKLRKCVESYLSYTFSNKEMSAYQYEAGILFMKKTDFTINFFKSYLDIMINNIDAITDQYNNDIHNHKEFVENRHDQSVCSLLAKYHKIDTLNLCWADFHN